MNHRESFGLSFEKCVSQHRIPATEQALIDSLDRKLEAAVRDSISSLLSEAQQAFVLRVESVGSTARRTQPRREIDFDLNAIFMDGADLHQSLDPLLGLVWENIRESEELGSFLWQFYNTSTPTVREEQFREKGGLALSYRVGKLVVLPEHPMPLVIDIALAPERYGVIPSTYRKWFRDQVAGIAENRRTEVLAHIRTLKSLVQCHGIYDRKSGGLRSVGAEQLVLQSEGDFDLTMTNLYSYMVENDDGDRYTTVPQDSVVNRWVVINPEFPLDHPFYNVLNFLDRENLSLQRVGDANWNELARLAHEYHWIKKRDHDLSTLFNAGTRN